MKLSGLVACLLISGIATGLLSQPAGTLLWSYNAGDTITTSPAIAPDGTIYIGSSLGLNAITNAGSNKWSFPLSVASSPAIASNGTVYFGSQDGNLYAINPDGTQKWSYPAQGGNGSPAIGSDDTIYCEGYSFLYALTPSGTQKWKHLIGDAGPFDSPTLGPDGTVYIGAFHNNKFYALNPDGSQKWVFSSASAPGDSAAVGVDGTVYFTAGYSYAVTTNGTELWRNTDSLFQGTPVLGKDGTIYVENPDDNSLWSLKPNGQTNWSIATGPVFHGPPPTPPAIDSSGMLYYSASNTLFAVIPQGSIAWIFAGSGISSVSPCIGPDGTIYAAFGSTLYALKGTNALGSTPWPMYRQNLRHTGKVEHPTLQKPKKRADANFQFQLAGEVGQTYNIQRSSDLSLWSTFTNLVATNPPATFVDLSASNFNVGFYRAVLQ
jgi:outer membrane protein assembly factor BamB